MKRWVLFTVLLASMSSLAVAQTVIYGPPGISQTMPMAPPVAGPVVTPPASSIPTAPPITPVVITPPVTKVPTVQAVAPPVQPNPATRLYAAEKNAYGSWAVANEPAGEAFFNLGVVAKADDGTHGRSLGEVAREKRRCTPSVAGRTFTNEDFERTPGRESELPTLVKSVCPASE